MAISDVFTALGAGGLFSGGFSLVELVVTAVMTFFFAGSLALSILSVRSANAARQARGEAREALAAVREEAAEFRALAGDLERTAQDLASQQVELKDLQASQPSLSEPAQGEGDKTGPAPIERRFDPLPPQERGSMAEQAESQPDRASRPAILRSLLRRR